MIKIADMPEKERYRGSYRYISHIYGKGVSEIEVGIKQNVLGDEPKEMVGHVFLTRNQNECLPLCFGKDVECNSFILPRVGRIEGTGPMCILFDDKCYDLRPMTAEIEVLIFRAFFHFKKMCSPAYRFNVRAYNKEIMAAVEKGEIFHYELNADRYACRYLGKTKVISGLKTLEKRLIDAPESETKEYELWELRERIKLLEGAENAKKRPLQNGDGGDSATD